MVYGRGPRGKSPEALAHSAEMDRLREIRKEKGRDKIGYTLENEITPELEARLLEFERITNEYLKFLHEIYYIYDTSLSTRRDQNQEFLEMSKSPVSRLLHFSSGFHVASEESLRKTHSERDEEDRKSRHALEAKKQEFERQLELFSDLFENPIEVAYLSALDNVIKNRPSAQK